MRYDSGFNLERALQILGEPKTVQGDPAYSGGNDVELPEAGWVLMTKARNADENLILESNWHSIKEACAHSWDAEEVGEEWGGLQELSYRHWGWGSVDYLFLPATAPDDVVKEAGRCMGYLASDCPLLDEEDHSNREMAAMEKHWADLWIRDRIELIAEENLGGGSDVKLSIFAARRNHPPGYLESLRNSLYR